MIYSSLVDYILVPATGKQVEEPNCYDLKNRYSAVNAWKIDPQRDLDEAHIIRRFSSHLFSVMSLRNLSLEWWHHGDGSDGYRKIPDVSTERDICGCSSRCKITSYNMKEDTRILHWADMNQAPKSII